MNKFSKRSLEQLKSCHPDLQKLFLEVLKVHDCTVLEGHRNKEKQNKAFDDNKSQLKWPNGKHNSSPSKAVDVAPYPINWSDTKRFYYFAGIVLGIAHTLDLDIRFGGDWDQDQDLNNQNFNDLVHFEIIDSSQ